MTMLNVSSVAAFSLNDQLLAMGHRNGYVRLFDGQTYEFLAQWSTSQNGMAVLALKFTNNGERLIAGTKGIKPGFDALAAGLDPDDTIVRVWNMEDVLSKTDPVDSSKSTNP